jgi:prolipoprotein diacylglyceryltransferase
LRRRIPTQLLEMAWEAVLLLLLLRFQAALKPGIVFCVAMAGYSAPRFFFHRLREPTPASDGRFGRALLSAAILLVAGYLAWLLE